MANLALFGGKPVIDKPFPAWPIYGKEEEEALLRVLKSQQWCSIGGKEVASFEKEFGEFQGVKNVICTNSGHDALKYSIRASGLGPGDEIIIPTYTFIASASSILESLAIPVPVDVEPDTFLISPDSVESAITEFTKAIMPVHLGGMPPDMDRLSEIAEKHNLLIIEDAAQAWGAKWKGKGIGAYRDIGGVSFQASKNINSGEGGAILTNNDDFAAIARSIINCGREPDKLWYAHYRLGGNSRMTEFQGALLRAQLSRYPQQHNLRESNALYLSSMLENIPGIKPNKRDSRIDTMPYHFYIFRFFSDEFNGIKKDEFIKALQAEGVPCHGGYSMCIHEMPVMTEKKFFKNEFPLTYHLYNRKIDYKQMKFPVAEDASKNKAIWFKQNLLLADRQTISKIPEAIEKIYRNSDEIIRNRN